MDIDKMIRRRAIFLYNIVLITGSGNAILDGNYTEILSGFLHNNYVEYYPLFNLIYCINYDAEENNFVIHEEDSWEDMLCKYLDYFNSPARIGSVYEGISNGELDAISKLVELFLEYLSKLFDYKYIRRSERI